MYFIKTSLKNARDAIKAKNYEDVIKHCRNVLQFEADNYNAYVFLGVAQLNLNAFTESEQSYRRAIEINSAQPLAWQVVAALKYLLPTSTYYELIRGSDELPSPKQILLQIIDLVEKEESETIRREIEARRYRLNAGTPATIKAQVENEVYSNSELERFYDSLLEILDNSSDTSDVDKAKIFVNYVSHLHKKLSFVPSEKKQQLIAKIFKRAELLINCTLMYRRILNFDESFLLSDKYDSDLLKKYSVNFPDTSLSKIIRGYFRALEGDIFEARELYNEGSEMEPNSIFEHMALSWFNHDSKNYELALEYAKNGKDLINKYSKKTGNKLDRVSLSLELCMANCYLNIGAKFHNEAMLLYKKIRQKDQNSIVVLQGMGKILSSQGKYKESIEIFEEAIKLDMRDYISKSELGWDEEAGTQLGKYLESQGEEDLALGIYSTATQANSQAGWAWKQLGFSEFTNGNYSEAAINFQKALRIDTKDVRCWEGLAEAYRQLGRYTASMKTFMRAIELDPSSIYSHFQVANIKQKLGILDEAIDQYNITIEKAKMKGDENHLPSIKGIGDCYLELAKEYFSTGLYGRAAESLSEGLLKMHQNIETYDRYQSLWKLIGDLCITAHFLQNYLHLIPLNSIKKFLKITRNIDLDTKLHLSKDIDEFGLNLCDSSNGDSISNSDLILIILTCGCLAYKYAIVLSGNNPDVAPPLWYDLAIAYHKIFDCYSRRDQALDEYDHLSAGYMNVAIRCTKIALKFEPINSDFWNALGILTILLDAKISQHSFIKAIMYSPKNPILWANLGILYLFHSDLELAEQAFSTSRSLDPDYALAWVGQAYVANLWGNDEATELFEHAYEISGGHVLEADYGFASRAFARYKKSLKYHKSSLISPAFALKKFTEQNPNDPTSLNLLGLLCECLEQSEKSAELFNCAITLIEQKIQQLQQLFLAQDEDESSLSSKIIPFVKRLAYVLGNLGRVLCSARDFDGSIKAYNKALDLIKEQDFKSLLMISFKIYTTLGAGLAYYFNNELENSLKMIEEAFSEIDYAEKYLDQGQNSEDNIGIGDLRKDVAVLLSQALWALEGEEQTNMAEDELFACIEQNPNYLPAIFGLCAMGLLQDDHVLVNAAIKEMIKLPLKTTAYELISNPLSSASKNLGLKEMLKVFQNYTAALIITREKLKHNLPEEADEIIEDNESDYEADKGEDIIKSVL
ncbi:7249_t:CDS:10, partial [Acaulospora colombiana]